MKTADLRAAGRRDDERDLVAREAPLLRGSGGDQLLDGRGGSASVMRHPRPAQLGRAVATAGKVGLEQVQQGGHALLGERAVGDVLAGERGLVHGRAQVAGIDDVDREVGVLDGQDLAELLERGLRRAVRAPALVGLDRGVGGDRQDACAGPQLGPQRLEHAQLGDGVRAQDVLEVVEVDVGQRGQRRRPERARVEHEHVDAAEVGDGLGQLRPVRRVDDVAGEPVHPRGVARPRCRRGAPQVRHRLVQRLRAARVHHQVPAAPRPAPEPAPARARATPRSPPPSMCSSCPPGFRPAPRPRPPTALRASALGPRPPARPQPLPPVAWGGDVGRTAGAGSRPGRGGRARQPGVAHDAGRAGRASTAAA